VKTKAELDKLTDDVFVHLGRQRREGDPVVRAQLQVARDLADMLRTQFPDDAALAGRVAVVISQAQSQLIRAMRQDGIDERSVGSAAANVLAFAGEHLVREAKP
jgi:hypothetical protein